jgi:ATP-dependent DNA helicase RecG
MHPDNPIKSIPRITPKYQKILEKLGILTVRDFLFYFPFRYDDFRKTALISDDLTGQTITVEGRVIKSRLNRIFKKRMTVAEIIIEDANGTPQKAVWFNQPYILESLPQGSTARLSGKLKLDGKVFSMNSPAWEKAERDATNTGRLVPVYPETIGITSKWIRWQTKMLLPIAKSLKDPLPKEILVKYNLYDLYTAIVQLHFPDSREKLLRAQKRMAFQEMFLVQLKALQVKKDWEGKNSLDIKFDEKLVKKFVSSLPFKLTNAQRKSSFEILKDLEKPKPMNRLLNGDVGSGKTVVAAIAALQAMNAGFQVAIMAPTEVLARQHFESFCKLFENYDFNIALLTSSYKFFNSSSPSGRGCPVLGTGEGSDLATANQTNTTREKLLEKINRGNISLVIGTHALIQKDIRPVKSGKAGAKLFNRVKFKNLALVIIDEQHRFGVTQRAALQQGAMDIDDGKEKTIPHLLTMTATPIPRTLAIAFFGSLDLSILDEMPKNRKPIKTKVISPSGRSEIYNFIRHEIKSGRQAFIIFPLVEESQKITEVKAATEEHKRLSEQIFPELKLGLLHGKLKARDKESIMKEFKDKNIDILVATSVVEVGIDIPNATVLVIENAERFGLTQLHQFRGRVGRGEHQSYCFLFSETGTKNAIDRLRVMEATNDGFKIAEKDLELRGPGQFFGTLQSGMPDITMENLSNIKLIKFARSEAQEILSADPQLKKHPALRDALGKFSEKVHLE